MKNPFIFRKICSILSPSICASLFALALLTTGTGSANGQSSIPFTIGAEFLNSNATVTFGWQPVSDVQGYEVRLVLFLKDPVTYFARTCVPATVNKVTIARPRAGHFRAEVRSCRLADCDCTNPNNCSAWSQSTDPKVSMVGDRFMAWWIYWKVPKPIFE